MNTITNISETCQDLFAFNVNLIVNQDKLGYWVDFGARNWGQGFGQNNSVLLYNNGWSGLSMDIGNYGYTYNDLDKSRVHFEQIDCTDAFKVWVLFQDQKVPKRVEYLNFDIDEATEQGLSTLESLIERGDYVFNCITIEHDSYRFGTKVRDMQREMLTKHGYVLAAELDMYEDWWIHDSVYSNKFNVLKPISEIKHNGGFNKESLNKIKECVEQIINNGK